MKQTYKKEGWKGDKICLKSSLLERILLKMILTVVVTMRNTSMW